MTDAVRSSATVASCAFERKGRPCWISSAIDLARFMGPPVRGRESGCQGNCYQDK